MATVIKITATRDDGPASAPASRASWCGQIRIGDLSVPVKAYAAIATPPETPLRQLHAGCGQRIEYRKWCSKHGAVSPDEIVRGYPYQPDQYVEFSPTELEQLHPADDKTIHLEHFLQPSSFDPVLFSEERGRGSECQGKQDGGEQVAHDKPPVPTVRLRDIVRPNQSL